jgi:hypothetical protein
MPKSMRSERRKVRHNVLVMNHPAARSDRRHTELYTGFGKCKLPKVNLKFDATKLLNACDHARLPVRGMPKVMHAVVIAGS